MHTMLIIQNRAQKTTSVAQGLQWGPLWGSLCLGLSLGRMEGKGVEIWVSSSLQNAGSAALHWGEFHHLYTIDPLPQTELKSIMIKQ